MLDPRDRGALLEALRPPPGYVVSSALATTYSLDLLTLLTAPLAFSLYDRLVAREGTGPERLDSFALLHAMRQHAENLVVFCQSGCIGRPKGYRQLLAYLEDAVVQVKPPNEHGVFHPKLWVQRLTSESGPVRYRVLVLSRNLTFDRSWDTMLALDGELVDRKLAIGDSKPLGEFVEALPSLAVAPGALSESRKALVATIAEELRRVRFETPDGFDTMKFWPLGFDGKSRDPFGGERIERLLVVSPFVAPAKLEALASEGKRHVLVSRVDELETVPKDVLDQYAEVHILHDAAEEVDEEAGQQAAELLQHGPGPMPPSRGLHAKLYVADDGWNAHVWTGSANASNAAFEANVELLVQLTGPKSKHGVDAMLEGKGDGALGLRTLLAPFVAPERPRIPSDVETRLEDILREANRALSNAAWCARVAADQAGTFDVALTLRTGRLALPSGAEVRVWPISLPADRAAHLSANDATARFERCSFQALTSFFAFEVTATVGQRVERCEFVVRVALEGAPEDRSARVLHSLLDDPAKVLRFLRMLLAVDAFEALELLDPASVEGEERGATSSRDTEAVPLFESLVRTLEREPHRLREVDRLVRELRATPAGEKMLPSEFEHVWAPLWEAYERLEATSRRSK